MNHHFSNAQIYAPAYPPNHQQSTPQPRPQSHGTPHQTLPATHTLPPLTAENHTTSAFGSDTYPARTQSLQSLQPSLMAASREQDSQPGSYPVYAPTANAFYHGQNPNYSHTPQTQQLHQHSRPSSVNGLPQPVYTSAPAQARLPELLPMPPRGNGKPTLSLSNHINHIDAAVEPQITHVVGSQGRRGILPSSAGRPVAVVGANTNGSKAAPTPPKDADGKYPCQHCPKTYLHAKHLKRHLLRHTGARPYTCGLCKDTFSRSDILKRHFQKCSVRRGNPSGENHLTHSRANNKKSKDAARMASNTPTDVSQSQQLEIFSPASLDGSFDMNTLSLGQTQYVDNTHQVSRSNSLKKSKRSTGSRSNRVSLNRANLGLVNTSGYDPSSYAYASGHVTPDSATTSGAATPYTFMHESRSSQISPSGAYNAINGRDMGFGGMSRTPTSLNYSNGSLPHIAGQRGGQDMDWHGFNFNSHDDFGNPHFHSGTNTPIHPIKSEGDLVNLPIQDYPYLHPKE